MQLATHMYIIAYQGNNDFGPSWVFLYPQVIKRGIEQFSVYRGFTTKTSTDRVFSAMLFDEIGGYRFMVHDYAIVIPI